MHPPQDFSSRPTLLAEDSPWQLDPDIARQIRCTAAQMVGKAGLTQDDREDLEQDLTVDLLSRLSWYDPQRARLGTFVSRLLDNAAATIITARKAEKRVWWRCVQSLFEHVENSEGLLQAYLDLLENENRRSNNPLAIQAAQEQQALRIDLERFMAALPEKEREVCALLMQEDARGAARQAGMPRSSLYLLRRRLREKLKAAGFEIYL